MDPFTIALGAIAAIKQGVALYKEVKSTGKDVSNIAMEISGAIGNFFHAQEQVKETVVKDKKNPPKAKSLRKQALDNVMKEMELKRQAAELRQFLIYEADETFNTMWRNFEIELAKLTKQQQLEEYKGKLKAVERQQLWYKWELRVVSIVAVFVVLIFFSGLMYYIHQEAQDRKKDRFSYVEFEKRWVTDKRTKECWLEYQSTGNIPKYCLKDMR